MYIKKERDRNLTEMMMMIIMIIICARGTHFSPYTPFLCTLLQSPDLFLGQDIVCILRFLLFPLQISPIYSFMVLSIQVTEFLTA